jgi:hypothetical protein
VGVEKTVPLANGEQQTRVRDRPADAGLLPVQLAQARPPAPPTPPAAGASIRYQVMTTVPENWTPFVPVHVDGDNREIQLQRAALPRILEGDPNPPVKVQPRTVLLRQGLDQAPPQPYLVHEEEISRAGTRLTQAYQRTRAPDGRVYTWLRVRRQTGRGEGSSGLAFDQIPPVPPGS